jgi:hypothetical protein
MLLMNENLPSLRVSQTTARPNVSRDVRRTDCYEKNRGEGPRAESQKNGDMTGSPLSAALHSRVSREQMTDAVLNFWRFGG